MNSSQQTNMIHPNKIVTPSNFSCVNWPLGRTFEGSLHTPHITGRTVSESTGDCSNLYKISLDTSFTVDKVIYRPSVPQGTDTNIIDMRSELFDVQV